MRRGLALGDGRPDVLAVERLVGGIRPWRRPARAAVGMTSTMCSGSLTTRGLSLPGQLKIVGTRTPPSYRLPLPPRSSPLLAGSDSCSTPPCRALLRGVRAAREHRAARPAVVAAEDDQRVLAQPALLQRGDDPPDLVVERRDHRRVGAARRVLDRGRVAVLVLPSAPGTARAARATRSTGRTACFASCFSISLTASSPISVGVVALLLEERAVALPVDHAAALVGEVVDLADEVAVEVVEAAVLRPVLLVGMAQVPLADHRGLVAGFLRAPAAACARRSAGRTCGSGRSPASAGRSASDSGRSSAPRAPGVHTGMP